MESVKFPSNTKLGCFSILCFRSFSTAVKVEADLIVDPVTPPMTFFSLSTYGCATGRFLIEVLIGCATATISSSCASMSSTEQRILWTSKLTKPAVLLNQNVYGNARHVTTKNRYHPQLWWFVLVFAIEII